MDNREKPVVLVMDDEAQYREYAKTFFEHEGYRVTLSSTMKGAMGAIHSKEYAHELMVAFIDIHMQGGSVAHEIFAYTKRTAAHRVIRYAWTGDTTDDTHLAAVRSGAFRVFYKDIHSDDVILQYMTDDIELIRAHGEDDLTGLYNIRSFRRGVLEEMKTMREHAQPLYAALIFIDIDEFKVFNEVHGHLVGDETLKTVAAAMRRLIRPIDHICRKGGDEFLIWMPGLADKDAVDRALMIQNAVAQLSVEGKDGERVPISVSVGVAEVLASKIGEDLMVDFQALIEQGDKGKKEDKKTKFERRLIY